jgi:putative methyltransferase
MKKNVYLFQPQQGFAIGNKKSYWFPYSVGCLWNYAQQNSIVKDNYDVPEIFFKRSKINDIINKIENPSVAVFSSYLWNWNHNLKTAEAIKKKWPECLILFGGPQVTKRPYENSFFKKYPFIDTIIHGEGEVAFENLLVDLLNGIKPKRVISFNRLTELSYPSPYTSGIFDQIIKDNPNVGWQMVLETNRGCPYACTFCDWGSLTYSKVLKFSEERVLEEIEWSSRHKVEYLFLADANFGIFYERDKKFAQHFNQLQITTGYPKVVIAQWAKNSKEKTLDIAKIFFNNSNRGFTLSLQSMNDAVLDAIKRKNMDINDLESMLRACEREGINTYTELILGLPYETKETWKENFNKLLAAGQHNSVDVWMCQLLENSELNSPEQLAEHEIESIQVPKWIYGLPDDEDIEITEYETIVRSTKYMNFDELVDSYMFSHIIMIYHYVGWTQVLARFLHKYKNMSYLNFYNQLHDHVRNGKGIMTDEYNDIKKIFVNFLTKHNDVEILKKFKNHEFHTVAWKALKNTIRYRDKTFDQIFDLVTPEFCELDQTLYDDLKQTQLNHIFNYYDTYPKQVSFSHNVYDYIFNSKSDLEAPCTVNFEYETKWNSIDDLVENAYLARRKGVYKTKAEVVGK